jgi:predicted secreted protein
MKVTAKNVQIKVGGKKIAGATDASLSLTTAFATSQTKEDVGEVSVAERVDWTLDSSAIFGEEGTDNATLLTFRDAAQTGTRLEVSFHIGSMATYSGTAMVSSYTETAPVDGRPTYQANLKGVSSLIKG